jgi:hypothetical protein
MFKGRRFQDNSDGKIVTVMSENGSWVTLDDSRNIKTSVFLQKFSEYIEADNFFSNDTAMESLAQQFSEKININTVPVVGSDGSSISYTNPNIPPQQQQNTAPAGYFVDDSQLSKEAKIREAYEKFQNYTPPVIQDVIDENIIGYPQNQRVAPLQRRERPPEIHPEESEREIKDANTGQVLESKRVSYTESPSSPPPPPPQTDNIYDLYKQTASATPPPQQASRQPDYPVEQIGPSPAPQQPRNEYQGPIGNQSNPSPSGIQSQSPEQEAFMFFKKFKKVHPIKIEVSFDEMIADPNYVRQTAMNFEGDVIKFYTQELMKKIYADPTMLEEQIYDSLKLSIMGEEYVQKEKEEKLRENLKIFQSPKIFVVETDESKPLELELSESMKKAAQTIGLDLREVKPSDDRIESVSPTFKYEDGETPPPVKTINIEPKESELKNES